MADVTISRTYPETLAARIRGPLLGRVDGVYRHRLFQKLLARRGLEPDEETNHIEIDTLSDKAKIELLIDFLFWQIVDAEEKPKASQDAAVAQSEDLLNAFDGGGDE